MNPVYTIENTFDDGYPCVHTSTVFATDNLEIAKERFESYRKCCETKTNKSNNEYILYQWNGMEVVVKYLIGVTIMKKTNYKILFADLDGTLITAASKI